MGPFRFRRWRFRAFWVGVVVEGSVAFTVIAVLGVATVLVRALVRVI